MHARGWTTGTGQEARGRDGVRGGRGRARASSCKEKEISRAGSSMFRIFALAASVMPSQSSRSSSVSFLHAKGSTTTAASVICSQPTRASDVSCLHPEASAASAASVMEQ